MASKIVFLKTEWMDYYDGRESTVENPSFGHTLAGNEPHERWNFVRQKNGYYYGYAPVGGGLGNIDIRRHWEISDDMEYVDGIDVVFIATAPSNRGVVVVGWYTDARLYGEPQKRGSWYYYARAEIAFVIDPDARDSKIVNPPRRANVWYGRADVISQVRRLMTGEPSTRTPKAIPHRIEQDIERRLRIEHSAYREVIRQYTNWNYDVETVWNEHLGWDLEARKDGVLLRIEVKGTAGLEIAADLSPREYSKACQYKTYRICIVTEALTKHPRVHTFQRDECDAWRDKDNQELHLEPLTGARMSLI